MEAVAGFLAQAYGDVTETLDEESKAIMEIANDCVKLLRWALEGVRDKSGDSRSEPTPGGQKEIEQVRRQGRESSCALWDLWSLPPRSLICLQRHLWLFCPSAARDNPPPPSPCARSLRPSTRRCLR